MVDVAAIDPVKNIASTAIIRLLRTGYEIASAEGELKKRVVPGTYTAKAYLLGEETASEEFDVAAYEEKRIELPIRGVYFETFDRKREGLVTFIWSRWLKTSTKTCQMSPSRLKYQERVTRTLLFTPLPSFPLTEQRLNTIIYRKRGGGAGSMSSPKKLLLEIPSTPFRL